MVAKTLPENSVFLDACFGTWLNAVSQMVPSALLVLAFVAPMVRLFVTKALLEPEVK